MINLLLDQLLGRLVNTGSKKELKSFLKTVLTPKELVQIPKRLEILKQLLKGFKQRDISKNLKVSLCTVTRGSNILKLLEDIDERRQPDWWKNFKKMN
jgi:TrpR family trp operon transcriptional repressor